MKYKSVKIEIVGMAGTHYYAALVDGMACDKVAWQTTPEKALEAARAVYPQSSKEAKPTRESHYTYASNVPVTA